MPSSAKSTDSAAIVRFHGWNRRLHFYLGLYFLFFVWLFALSGWLLNHGRFAMAVGATDRQETRYERTLAPLAGGNDTDRARDIMRQLQITGEISWPASQPRGALAFGVSRPTDSSQVRVDLETQQASVQYLDNSAASAFRILHTFSGSRYVDANEREWIITTVWVGAMDALAIGLVLMVLGSYVMWWRLKRHHTLGILVLAVGVVSCWVLFGGLG
jgi:hypothetical protein